LYLSRGIQQLTDKPTVSLTPMEKGIEIGVEDNLEDSLELSQRNFLEKLVSMYQAEEKYTGLSTKDQKNRFLLFPPEIFINQDTSFFAGIYLTVFKHGYATLQLSFNIEKWNFSMINDSAWNIPFDKAYVPELLIDNNQSFKMRKKARCNDILTLLEVYKDSIVNIISGKNSSTNADFFYHLTLTKFSYNLDNFEEQSSKKLNEKLYQLLCAPSYNLKSDEEINRFINKRYYSFSKNLRLYANSNRIISIYTRDYKELIAREFKEEVDLKDEKQLNDFLHNTSLGATINSIEFIMLKKAAQKNYMYEIRENISLKTLTDLLIKENINYTMEFSKYFYSFGTVRDLMYFMEEKCEDFIQSTLINERAERIERIIRLKKE